MDWISVEDRLPELGERVDVKFTDSADTFKGVVIIVKKNSVIFGIKDKRAKEVWPRMVGQWRRRPAPPSCVS